MFQIYFFFQIVQQNLGSVIKGKMDSINKDVIYTDLFISRMRAKIRGLFSAITRYVLFCYNDFLYDWNLFLYTYFLQCSFLWKSFEIEGSSFLIMYMGTYICISILFYLEFWNLYFLF